MISPGTKLPAAPLVLSSNLSLELEKFARAHENPEELRKRCWIVLMAAEGISNGAIARTLKLSRPTVLQWHRRFESFGKNCLFTETLSTLGRPTRVPNENRERLRQRILYLQAEKVSLRKIAKAFGISKSTLHRLLRDDPAHDSTLSARHCPKSR